MTKSRKHSKGRGKGTFKKMIKTTQKAIPVIGEGLKTVGNTAKVAVVKSAPIVEKGVSKKRSGRRRKTSKRKTSRR